MRFGRRQLIDNTIDINDLNQKIYRIFNIKRFKEVITKNEMVLVTPSKWDDPFENFFLKANVINENGEIGSLQNIAEKWYGQCWTLNIESDAMWRIYSPNKDGVRISTTIQELFSILWDDNNQFAGLRYFIGKLKYKTRSDIENFMRTTSFSDMALGGQNDNFARLLCIKRLEFEHEQEVRLLANDTDNTRGCDGCYRIQFDYKKVFEDVCLDPRLDSQDFKDIKKSIEDLGCTLPITQSDLYKVTFPAIRL